MNTLKPPGSYLTVREVAQRDKRNGIILDSYLHLLNTNPVDSPIYDYAVAGAMNTHNRLHQPQSTLRK